MGYSDAMKAYFAHRLANAWWTPCADEAAQWVADYVEQQVSQETPWFDDADASGDIAIWRRDEDRPDYPQPVLYMRDVKDNALWDLILKEI